MSTITRHRFNRTLIAVAVLATYQANAQDAQETTPQKDANLQDIERVEVVGKFQQSLIDRIPIIPKELPFTLNTLDRRFIDQRNFARPIEALTTLPNITRTEDRLGTGTANFLSRGFEAPILVDNRVQNNFRGSGARDDAFVERYEVLKGPASISLGPIGAGGVINTVTKIPEQDYFAGGELRADHFGSLGGELDVNFGESLGSDKVLLRVSGAYRDFKFDASETRRENFAIRPVVTVDFSRDTTLRASVAYTENTTNPNFGFPLMSDGSLPDGIDTDTFTGFANGEANAEDVLTEAELKHQFLDNLKLTLRGSRQKTDFDYKNTAGLYNYNAADGSPGIGQNDPFVGSFTGGGATESEASFFDVQLAYDTTYNGQRQDIVVGVAYDDRSFERLFSAFTNVGPFRLDNLDEPRFGPEDIGPLSPFTLTDQTLQSVFAEAAFRPNAWLTILGGIRFDDLEQTTVNIRGPREITSVFDDSEMTFRLGATAAVNDDVNVYASFAQAFSPQFGVQRDSGAVGPELSDGFEIGLKGLLLDKTLSFETGFFHTIRKDVAVRDPNNLPGEFFVISVGELTAQGFEFSGIYRPLDGLTITANLGLTDIEIQEGGQDVTAAVFPERTGSLYVSYEFQSGALSGLRVGGGTRYVDERDGPVVTFESYRIADFNLAYPINDAWEIAFDILNITDERYLENVASFAQNITGGLVLGPPRTAVLTLRSTY